MSTEPWLRGPIDDLHPVAAHLLYTFTQCREELAQWTPGLESRVDEPVDPLATLGFHLRHLTGSIDRLTTYLEGRSLDECQMQYLREEKTSRLPWPDLLAALHAQLDRTAAIVRDIPAERYLEPRSVGRQGLPTTVAGLIIHLSEHTQRHLGQAILTARLLRSR